MSQDNLEEFEERPKIKELKAQLESFEKSPRSYFTARYGTVLITASLFFFGIAIFLFLSLGWWIIFQSSPVIIDLSTGIRDIEPWNPSLFFAYYVTSYSAPISLLLSAIICILMGYGVLQQAGGIGEEVVPAQDRALLTQLSEIDNGKNVVDRYVRLKSLGGATGFFTKIGITGLPLATIGLTLIFASLGVLGLPKDNASKFFDFANLTLGAFLGSYVQKHKDSSSTKTSPGNSQEGG